MTRGITARLRWQALDEPARRALTRAGSGVRICALFCCLFWCVFLGGAPAAAEVAGEAEGGQGAVAAQHLTSAANGRGVAPAPRGRWAWPLSPAPDIIRRFQPPGSQWGAGHRGIDLAGAPGDGVLVVADGTVSHVGVIAGRGTVSVLHADGVRSTYEPVEPVAGLHEGATVTRGQVLGRLSTASGHCAPSGCLHLGAIRGRTYLDPLTHLSRPRIILLPVLAGS